MTSVPFLFFNVMSYFLVCFSMWLKHFFFSLHFFSPFKLLVTGGKVFFPFYPGSQCVLIMFHLSSQWVPIRFSICVSSSQCVPQNVLNSTSLESHMLWQMLSSFHLYIQAKGEEFYFLCWVASIVSLFFWVMGESNWLIAKNKKKIELGRHLI
jgi:hypothetical protein